MKQTSYHPTPAWQILTATLIRMAWRNLWRNRKRTLITLSSIAIGFALAVLFIGMGDGSHNSMIRNAIQLGEGHITIQPKNYQAAPSNHLFLADGKRLEQTIKTLHIPGKVMPRITIQTLASTANNAVGAGLLGIETDSKTALDPMEEKLKPTLVSGGWLKPNDNRGVVIGSGMARKLKAKVGNKIVLMAGKKGGDSQAYLAKVRGIFNAPLDEMNDFFIVSHLSFARQFLLGEGGKASLEPVTRFAIFLNNSDTQDDWKQQLKIAVNKAFPVGSKTDTKTGEDTATPVVLDWQEMMPQLIQFIALDNAGNYVFLVFILIMVVFGILNTVLMSVLERTREFGLLRALGMNRRHLLFLVLFESLLLSFLAIIVGWFLGGLTQLWFSHHGIDFSAFMEGGTSLMGTMMDPIIYTELSWDRVKQLTIIVFVTTLITGIYPAVKAAKVTPIEALRT
ncbi:ABC transporter permease [Hydrogenovibrio kuenenii]|uniref:ABC transporter permease n=1 Tax=Hydrogenovibrio kuenenii TaxID=63658 RepID=UPI000467002C|nr:FtsX-like permease family protein [Hydrogenovibrio kuenenii]